jgi:hypothetical protein
MASSPFTIFTQTNFTKLNISSWTIFSASSFKSFDKRAEEIKKTLLKNKTKTKKTFLTTRKKCHACETFNNQATLKINRWPML